MQETTRKKLLPWLSLVFRAQAALPLGQFIIAGPHCRLPLQKNFREPSVASLRHRGSRHGVNKHIADARIKHASGYPLFSKHQKGNPKAKQNPCLKVVPWGREWNWGTGLLLFQCPGFPDPGFGFELVKTKNHSPGAMPGDNEHFSKRQFRRVVGTAKCPCFQAQIIKFA